MFNRFRNLRVYNAFKGFQDRQALRSHALRSNLLTKTGDNSIHTNRLSPSEASQGQASSYMQLFQENKEKAIEATKSFMALLKQATKDAYHDARYLANLSSTKPKTEYTVGEILETQRIKKDLIKFVPYYAAMILPGGAAALLFIRSFFPRGTPTYFMSEEAIKKQREKYLENQAKAHGALMDYLLAAMKDQGYDTANRSPADMKKFFVEHQAALLEALRPRKMSSEMIKNASDFLVFEYVDGTYIINTIYRTVVNLPRYAYNFGMWATGRSYRAVWTHPFFTYQFKLNSIFFEDFKEELIRGQFEKQLKLLKAENLAMIDNSFGEMKKEDYVKVAQERGYLAKDEEEARMWIKRQWVPVIQENAENEMFAFWMSVMYYKHH